MVRARLYRAASCLVAFTASLSLTSAAFAGPYAPPPEQPGSTAIAKDDVALVAWAAGYSDYVIGTDVDLVWQTPLNALGAAQGIVNGDHNVVTLGNGGRITLTFDSPIVDGPGFDFAVFENGLTDGFLELAFVEVSANGVDYFRMPNDSLTPGAVPGFGSLDPTNFDGLAGKYRQSFGTPFDLALVGLTSASHVRIVDIIGDGTALDTSGDPIYDPTPTVGSGGFDLDAIGVLNTPEPASAALLVVGAVLLLPRRRRLRGRASDSGTTIQKGNPQMMRFVLAGVLGTSLATSAAAVTAGFEDVPLAPESAYYGQDGMGQFTSGGVTFPVDYLDFGGGFFAWEPFAASNVTDNTTAGFGNQFSAITGSGANGSSNYGVGFAISPATLDLPKRSIVDGLFVTNTTFAALTMRDGDFFSKQFGGLTGDDPDFFRLDIEGLDQDGSSRGIVEFYLADYRFADNSLDYIIDEWTWLDLSSLGTVTTLRYSLASTDVGSFGINTPTYFALDDLTYQAVPEPASAVLAGLAVMGLMVSATRRRR